MRLAIIADPADALKVQMDTTLLVAAESNRRGHEVFYTTPNQLFLTSDGPSALWHRFLYRGLESERPQDRLEDPSIMSARDFGVILMRQDPPVDEKYTTVTHILERSDTCVVNNPADVRSFNEKISVLRLPEVSPPSLVSIDPERIASFVRESPEGCVLKPLNLFNGIGVLRLERDNPNLPELIRRGTEDFRKYVIIQHFVPAVANGDKRVFLVDGKAIGHMNRVPVAGEWRANIHLGATPQRFDLSARDREIVERVAGLLSAYDLPIACIDIIGDYLTEINVTSPSGIPEINRIYGNGHEQPIVDYLELRSKSGKIKSRPVELG